MLWQKILFFVYIKAIAIIFSVVCPVDAGLFDYYLTIIGHLQLVFY